MTDELLNRIERYYDEAPRANADPGDRGPFTIFRSRGGWPYYARPRLGFAGHLTRALAADAREAGGFQRIGTACIIG